MHGGLGQVLSEGTGSGTLPSTGAVVQGLLSASTLLLGDGARLFNDNQTAGGSTALIVPLDGVARSAAIARERSLVVGARLDRRLTDRLGVEIAGEYRRGRLAFQPDALSGIESARASAKSAVEGALSRYSTPSSVSTTVTVLDRQRATQLVATASLIVNLKESGRLMPYAALGGGVVINDATSPKAALVGTYHVGSPAQLMYTDSVALGTVEDDRVWMGVAGGGVKVAISSRWGVRFDARGNLYRNTRDQSVDVSPTLGLQSTGQPFPILTTGAVQFSPIAPLTGSPLGATTFSGSGFQMHVVVSSGLFLRF